MMYSHVIARRYAKALLLSLSGHNLDQILEDLRSFAANYTEGSDLQRLCEDPTFTPLDRRDAIKKIAEKAHFDPVLLKFMLLLVEKKRISLIEAIYLSFARMVDQKEGRLRVRISSASPVLDHEIDEIKETLKRASKKEILAETTIDQGLLGGIRVEAAGTVFDGTLKAKLSALENLLLNDIGQ